MAPSNDTTPASQQCWRLYEGMRRIRFIEEAIADNYGRQQMRCPVHLSIGQEAVAVGVCSALDAGDLVMSGHRSHAHFLAKGGNLKAMIAEMHGKETGCTRGRGGSMHLVDLSAGFMGAVPIVGSTISIATGLAFADLRLGRKRITAAFFGEGASEEGVFHESLNFASLHKLPILYVCENNLYSVYTPLTARQPTGRTVRDLAAAHGMAAYHGDGNNVLEVAALTSQARLRLMSGEGPVFLELSTYRWREHCGPSFDNNIGYRSEAEFLSWKERDPILNLERHMRTSGIYDEARAARHADSVAREQQEAFAFAAQSPFPAVDTLLDYTTA